MTNHNRPIRRGAALLIVLAALILTVTASVSLARLASTTKMQRTLDRAAILGDDLLRATEAPIIAWLESESAQVVLPPEVEAPRIGVLHDTWSDGKRAYEVDITAWDQCGMVPIQLARSGSPLRLALPADVRRALDQVKIKPNEPPGLDLFLAAADATDDELKVFPRADSTEPLVFVDALNPAIREDVDPQPRSLKAQPIPLAVGAFVATHSGGGGLSGGGDRINVNSAPPEVLKQALRAAGRGGLKLVLAARAEGRSASLGDLRVSSSSSRAAPQIVGSSLAWSFRIDVQVGPLRRSWWAVYVKTRSSWECVQRLAIAQ
ncbi:MAG: hypothetical protein V3T84_01425 [Phycisphaerales bacterium]